MKLFALRLKPAHIRPPKICSARMYQKLAETSHNSGMRAIIDPAATKMSRLPNASLILPHMLRARNCVKT